MDSETKTIVRVVAAVAVVLVIGGGGAMYGCPKYRVWEQTLVGQAELARAEQNRNIAVKEAQAKMDSAKMLADAEVARARGVAEANRIIGESLKGNESYLRYLWIQGLQDGNGEVVYVPTEANLPILEARDNPPRSAAP